MLRTYTFTTSIGYICVCAYSLAYAYKIIEHSYPKDIEITNVEVSL